MSKRECDIIKDLLPSYVDEICSVASKEWIEEHLKECEECRALAERMRHTEISAKRLEFEQLDAGRKVIRQNLKRSLISLGLSALMFAVLMCSFFWDNGQIPILLLPVCMAMTWLVSRNQTKRRVQDTWDYVFCVVSLLAMCYGAGMMFLAYYRVTGEEPLFGKELAEIGPFLTVQIVVVAVICGFIYLWQLLRILKQGRAGSVLMNLCLMGIFLMLSYDVLMRQLTDLAVAQSSLWSVTAVVLILGIMGTVFFAVLDKLAKK